MSGCLGFRQLRARRVPGQRHLAADPRPEPLHSPGRALRHWRLERRPGRDYLSPGCGRPVRNRSTTYRDDGKHPRQSKQLRLRRTLHLQRAAIHRLPAQRTGRAGHLERRDLHRRAAGQHHTTDGQRFDAQPPCRSGGVHR